jgi:Protein of unknown function (DUF2569)
MVRRWQQIPIDLARQHPLYGVGGWLIVFVIGLALGFMGELGAVRREVHNAGMTLGDFFSLDHPAVSYLKLTLGLQTLIVTFIYLLLFTKHPSFRNATSALLLGGWPAASLLGIVYHFPGIGLGVAIGFFPWAISCAVWVTYLQRSKRVRITFEHSVAVDTNVNMRHGPHNAPSAGVAASLDARSTSVAEMTIDPTIVLLKNQHAPSYAGDASNRHEKPDARSSSREARASDQLQVAANSEEDFWATAAEELVSDARRKGLWAKAFAEAQGNETVAKASYLKWRFEQLQHDDTVRRSQLLAEQTVRRHANEQQASAEAAQAEMYRRSVKDLDTSAEALLRAFVESVPRQHAAYVFSLRNEVGGTLLHTAAREGFVGIAETLLAKGADPSIAGPKGLLPHQVAAQNKQYWLAQLLEQSLNAQSGQPPSAAVNSPGSRRVPPG